MAWGTEGHSGAPRGTARAPAELGEAEPSLSGGAGVCQAAQVDEAVPGQASGVHSVEVCAGQCA